jgi:hypothetical protein
MRVLGFLTTLAVLGLPISVSADAVSSHMASTQWMVGTWHCSNGAVIGGKVQKSTSSVEQITRRGPWIDFVGSTDKNSLVSLTYDPRRAKYVFVGTGSDSSYFVGNAIVTRGSIAYDYPSIASDPADDTNPSTKVTMSGPNQYVFTSAGTGAGGANKGKAYTYKSVCTRT